jgi:hypothetical protein
MKINLDSQCCNLKACNILLQFFIVGYIEITQSDKIYSFEHTQIYTFVIFV